MFSRMLNFSTVSKTWSHFLKPIVRNASMNNFEYIDKIVKGDKLVVFMKGTPQEPMCGFSKAVMDILNFHRIGDFETHNVLDNEQLRKDIKEYSNWPTIPQIYIKGEMVGGCEIFLEMHKNGSIVQEFEKIGLVSKMSFKNDSNQTVPDKQ